MVRTNLLLRTKILFDQDGRPLGSNRKKFKSFFFFFLLRRSKPNFFENELNRAEEHAKKEI